MASDQSRMTEVSKPDSMIEYIDLISDSESNASDDWPITDVAIQTARDKIDTPLEEQGLVQPAYDSEEGKDEEGSEDDDDDEEEAWESESLYADALEGMTNGAPIEACE